MSVTPISLVTSRSYRAILDALPDHLRGEVIAGQLVVMPRPAPAHAHAIRRLSGTLGARHHDGEGGPAGWWIFPEVELTLGVDPDFDPVIPDISGWRREHLPAFPEGASISVAPDWVCEVLSPRTARSDRGDKLPFYARAKVDHVWLVDPSERTLEAYSRDGTTWRPLGVWRDDAMVRAEPFADSEIALSAVWLR